MSTATYLRTRVDRSPLVPALLVGDVAVLLLFTGIGISTHGGSPLAEPGDLALTGAPFVLSWLLLAFLGGLFTEAAVRSPRRALRLTVPAWVIAALLGQVLRATKVFPGDTALSFALVTIFAGGALLVGWRLAVATLRSVV